MRSLWTLCLVVLVSTVAADPGGIRDEILEDIKRLNATCPKFRDSCKIDKGSRISDSPNWDNRNCMCDSNCAVFGDCCPDAKFYVSEEQREAADRFTCINLRQYKGNMMIAKCPAVWGDDNTRALCELSGDLVSPSEDPMLTMPVTSKKTGFTYTNIHCAVCNQDIPPPENGEDQVRFWMPRMECGTLTMETKMQLSMSNETAMSLVTWDAARGQWGINVDTDGTGPKFHECVIDPYMPPDVEFYMRPCKKFNGTCASNFSDPDVREKCSSYTSLQYRPSGMITEPTEVFRNVHCAICNFVPLDQLSCDEGKNMRGISFNWNFEFTSFALLFDLNDNDGSGVVGRETKCSKGELYDPFSRKCRSVFCSKGYEYREGRCISTQTTAAVPTEPSAVPPTAPTTVITTAGTEEAAVSENGELVPTAEVNSTVAVIAETTTAPTTSGTVTVPNTTTPAGGNMSTDFLSCAKFLLSKEEVELWDNGTLRVTAYGMDLQEGHYEIQPDGNVLVCAQGVTSTAKFDPLLGWVTVAGLGVSEVCLALHLIASMISPDLQNLSGRNLASLSSALFFAYGLFIAAQFIPTGNSYCMGVAAGMHYFFLAAFWWSSVLAWDVWRTLRLATTQLRSPSGKQNGKFVLYSLYAWILPALIVAAAVVIDVVDLGKLMIIPSDFHPHFGQHVCWFGQRKALLVFFAAPLAAILGVNVVLFICSACMIRNTTATSPTSCGPPGSRKQLGLYSRLALLMGLSWIAGLIAGAADFAPFWYIFVVLCSLQGVFILISFTCNRKVVRSLRSRLRFCSTRRRRATYRTALVGAGKGGALNRRTELEARDSHDSQASNTSQTSQSSLTQTTSRTST